jgi:hypothetical protein
VSFSYDLATDIGKCRLELGDTSPGAGVKPDGTNLSNEELQVWLDREGGVMLAVAAACEALARQWSGVADLTVGPRSESAGAIAEKWETRAGKLRDVYGYGDEDAGAYSGGFSVETKRVDEYSDEEDA